MFLNCQYIENYKGQPMLVYTCIELTDFS